MLSLRPYQDDALSAIEAARDRGINRALVALPTGCGKTIVFSSLLKQAGGTALILAHRDELLKQAADKLRTVAPELGMSIGFVQAAKDDTNSPIVIGSVQTLASPKRLARLPRRFDRVIIDEAHHATAASYRRILEHVEADMVIGFTATPERADDARLSDVWEEIVYARSLIDMIEAGYLSNLSGVRVQIQGLDLTKVKTTAGEYQVDALAGALHDAHAPEYTAAAIRDHASDRKTIVFVPTVALAAETAHAIRSVGLKCAHVHGEMPMDERRDTLAAFTAGDLQVVVNVDVLTEGYDEPSVDCVAIAAPTKSRIAYVQRVGRGTRLHPGKTDCLILDLVGVTEDLKLQSLPTLFELRKPPKPKETVTQAIAREARETAEAMGPVDVSRLKSSHRQAELFDRTRMNWLQTRGRWVTSLGRGDLLALDPVGNDWRVLLVRDTGARVLATGLDLGYAQGAAEETVRNVGAVHFVDNQAGWRAGRPSSGQLRRLKHLGITTRPETKGEASDLITTADAGALLERLDAAIARTNQEATAA